MDETTIARLIDKLQASQITELDYTNGETHLHLTKAATAPVPATPVTPDVPVEDAQIVAPLVGIAYLAEKPDAPVFKQVGDSVAVGEVVCVIESMKMMNPVKSTVAGVVTACLIEDAALVEYHQPLFTVKEEVDA